jgi:hypothetical protein
MAENLIKISCRAAGALAGVLLEGHLQRLADAHRIITKKNPTIGDLNDPLKKNGVYDDIAWKKIQFLGGIRNRCSHKKDAEPTAEQVSELIQGVAWAVKNLH